MVVFQVLLAVQFCRPSISLVHLKWPATQSTQLPAEQNLGLAQAVWVSQRPPTHSWGSGVVSPEHCFCPSVHMAHCALG